MAKEILNDCKKSAHKTGCTRSGNGQPCPRFLCLERSMLRCPLFALIATTTTATYLILNEPAVEGARSSRNCSARTGRSTSIVVRRWGVTER